ncbi:MAG: response regulator [Spartobacteria bacterium]|nr:response regulator [Spartobacteria bacterium]
MKKRALIIEDNENNMELITFILDAYGYETLMAVTGREGYERAVAELPDFVILDIQLPDILGTEVLQMLRATPTTAHIPVIAMTSFAMAGDEERLLAAGCDGYIEKPINPDNVMERIGQIIEVEK